MINPSTLIESVLEKQEVPYGQAFYIDPSGADIPTWITYQLINEQGVQFFDDKEAVRRFTYRVDFWSSQDVFELEQEVNRGLTDQGFIRSDGSYQYDEQSLYYQKTVNYTMDVNLL